VQPRSLDDKISIVYVGTLTSGKRPLYAIKLVEQLLKSHPNIEFSMYGNGNQKEQLQQYIVRPAIGKGCFSQREFSSRRDEKSLSGCSFFIVAIRKRGLA